MALRADYFRINIFYITIRSFSDSGALLSAEIADMGAGHPASRPFDLSGRADSPPRAGMVPDTNGNGGDPLDRRRQPVKRFGASDYFLNCEQGIHEPS